MSTQNIIFNISGGLGKNIMATAVVRAIKKAYPDSNIVVSTPHRDVWLGNPNVNEIINLETTPHFFRDYIYNKNALIFRHDPYLAEDFIYRRAHLTKIWCDLCDVAWDGEKPDLYFTEREKSFVKKILNVGSRRKLFFIQTNGGAPIQSYPISWARDLPLPIAEKIVKEMLKKGYRVIHLRRDNQPVLAGAEYFGFSHRQALCAIQFSDKRLFIDSFTQHTASAFRLSSTVVWIVNSPEVFGYKLHKNLVTDIPEAYRHHIDSYLDKYDITGRLEECPFETNDIFSAEKILKTLT